MTNLTWNTSLLSFLHVILVMLPVINLFAKKNGHVQEYKYEDLIHISRLRYIMEVIRLPERMYWHTQPEAVFHACNFGRFKSIHKFEEIIN